MSDKDNADVIFKNFEWSRAKAETNLKLHRVSFEEAATVFEDPFFVIFNDPEHSFEERRFIIIGMSDKFRHLFVSFTERGERSRIISSRKLTVKERKDYEIKKQKF
ncbi:hypothetical protein BH20ACI1_BH20ACI1_12680 [soil metagenome]